MRKDKIIFVTENGMMHFDGSKLIDIESSVLKKYRNKVRELSQSHEWKSNGRGAEFLGVDHQISVEEALENIHPKILCAKIWNGKLIYSLSLDGMCGIYSKDGLSDTDEGVLLSDASYSYKQFDFKDKRFIVTAELADETHLAIVDTEDGNRLSFLTEGSSVESSPCWSRQENAVYYSSAGLEILNDTSSQDYSFKSLNEIVSGAVRHSNRRKGPSSICKLDISCLQIDELLCDEKYNYEKPALSREGILYFIRRPYKAEHESSFKISDILLAPIRFLSAIVGFMNIFTIKYSGKTLTGSGPVKAKQKSLNEMIIEGNIINAEEELKKNSKHGEENPGIIPRSYELCKLEDDNSITVVKKGVNAFLLENDGSIIVSNGSVILRICADGTSKKICKAEKVIQIIHADTSRDDE